MARSSDYRVNRRAFMAALGDAAVWPVVARAQQPERMRRIGALLPAAPDDTEFQSSVGAFLQGLAQSGWITGQNIRIETRWTKFDPEDTRKYAAELVALAPDVILASGNSTVGPLLHSPARSRSCFRRPLIRSPPVWLKVWRGRAATPPGL